MSRGVPLAIVNPASGGSVRDEPSLKDALERRLGPVDLVATEASGHAIDLARRGAQDGRELIVAVGGDGTLHEVVNGVLDAGGAVAVGMIGRGTGGDFRRSLGLANRLDAYVDAIAAGRERTLDVGRVRYRAPDGTTRTRWFLNVLSVGMGGLVDRYVARSTKALGGRVTYFLASLRALVACRRARVRCRVGLGTNREERGLDSFMIAVCNGRYFGAGMHVAPMAAPDDGRFEVVSMDAPGKLAFVTFSRKIYDGSHLTSPWVTHFACDRIAIDLERDDARDVFLLDVDGEALGGVPLEVELVPRALRFRA